MEVLLEMRSTKFHHYSVAIGGFVDGNEYGDESNIVEAFFVNFWVQKASMIEKRYPHGCHVGLFEGNKGVFVRLVLQSSKRRVASNTGFLSDDNVGRKVDRERCRDFDQCGGLAVLARSGVGRV